MADLLGDALALTLSNYRKQLYNNVMTSTPFMKFMFEKQNVVYAKGKKIEAVIAKDENKNVQWSNFGDVLPTSINSVLTTAVYDWKVLDCTLPILVDEKDLNSGPEQILPLVKTLLTVQETSCKNAMAKGIFSDGSDPKSVNGLQLFIADDPTTGVVGQIDRATNPFWRNQSLALDDPKPQDLVTAMGKMLLSVIIDADRPKAIIMDANYYEMYESTLQNIQRVIDARKADAGYMTLEFKGIPVIYDPNCPPNHCYIVNTTYLYMVGVEGKEFHVYPPNRAYNQLVDLYIMHYVGNMILTDSHRQGVIFTQTQEQKERFNERVRKEKEQKKVTATDSNKG
jgi:hypothetical protein